MAAQAVSGTVACFPDLDVLQEGWGQSRPCAEALGLSPPLPPAPGPPQPPPCTGHDRLALGAALVSGICLLLLLCK